MASSALLMAIAWTSPVRRRCSRICRVMEALSSTLPSSWRSVTWRSLVIWEALSPSAAGRQRDLRSIVVEVARPRVASLADHRSAGETILDSDVEFVIPDGGLPGKLFAVRIGIARAEQIPARCNPRLPRAQALCPRSGRGEMPCQPEARPDRGAELHCEQG